MGGNIAVDAAVLDPGLPISSQITGFHRGTATPRFGGEIETALGYQGPDGPKPIAYSGTNQPTARHVLHYFIDQAKYSVAKEDESGNPYVLEAPDGSVVCFERYASVLERADRSFPADQNGFSNFIRSVNGYALNLDLATAELGLFISPLDFDDLFNPGDFTGTEAPSPERYGRGSLLDEYDRRHPRVDEIDRRAVSCHFSMGFRDPHHLKRMMGVMTYLTPGIYAAYSTVNPTVLAGEEGHILNAAESSGFRDRRTLLAPRALAWELAVDDRAGLPRDLVHAVTDPAKTFKDIVGIYCRFNAIGLPGRDSFKKAAAGAGPVTLKDYMTHIGTLWFDHRADPLRLEARMAGSGVWKLKSLACLLKIGLMDMEVLSSIEKALGATAITAEDIIEARKNVPFQGMNTPIGAQGRTVSDILRMAVYFAKPKIPAPFRHEIAPLEAVLRANKSDADCLLENPELLRGLMDTPFSVRLPLAMTAAPSPDAAFGDRRRPDKPSFAGP